MPLTQRLDPSGDISNSGWTSSPLWEKLYDGSEPNDSTYIQSSGDSEVLISLSNPQRTPLNSNTTVTFRALLYIALSESTPLTVSLYESSSLIGQHIYAYEDIAGDGVTYNNYSFDTTSSISNFNNLNLKFSTNGGSDVYRISWAKVDVSEVYYDITAVAGANGTITPSGISSVISGSNITYTISPNSGYNINDVKIDGASIGVTGSYTFTNVVANHTISSSFSAIPAILSSSNTCSSAINDLSTYYIRWSGSNNYQLENCVSSSGGEHAFCQISASTFITSSAYLYLTNFKFNIPTSSVINGVKLQLDKAAEPTHQTINIKDSNVNLIYNGAVTGTNKASSSAWLTGSFTPSYYGGMTDTWGIQMSASLVNSSSFGVAVKIITSGSATTGSMSKAKIDYAKLTVYYT